MVCQGIETLNNTGIAGFLSYPTSCDYHFYAKMMGALFIILSLSLFSIEKAKLLKGDMISSMGVSAIATIFVSFFGTLLGIIESGVFIEIFVVGLIFVALWIFKK